MENRKPTIEYFDKYINFLKDNGLYPVVHDIDGPSTSPTIKIGGEKFLTFCSNNYLSLAGNKKISEITKKSIDKYGVGSGSTRLLSGSLNIQKEFESKLASFFAKDGSITFSSGYLANAGVIRMLVDPFPYFELPNLSNIFGNDNGLIISDELNHASIIDGVRLAKSSRIVYKHSDLKDLERILKGNKKKRKLIITDGVFSMDGDIANLREISKLAKDYNAILFVDDSHAVGVLGPQGQGVAHMLGVEKEVDVIMGSFTKAFGSIGGFVTANNTIIDYLRLTARSYIFSDPIPPAIVSGLIATLKMIETGEGWRKKVLSNADRLRRGLIRSGFSVIVEGTPIVPLLIGDEKRAIQFSNELNENKILAPCIRKPAVIEGKERIRLSVMTSHSFDQIDFLLSVCHDVGKKLKLI
jgi:8-amino-7-oxononanoate synthase